MACGRAMAAPGGKDTVAPRLEVPETVTPHENRDNAAPKNFRLDQSAARRLRDTYFQRQDAVQE